MMSRTALLIFLVSFVGILSGGEAVPDKDRSFLAWRSSPATAKSSPPIANATLRHALPYLDAYAARPDTEKQWVQQNVKAWLQPAVQPLSLPKSKQLMHWPMDRHAFSPIVDAKRSLYPESMQDDPYQRTTEYFDKKLTFFNGHAVWRNLYAVACRDNALCREQVQNAPLAGDYASIVLKHVNASEPAPKLLAKLISGIHALVSLQTCRIEQLTSKQDQQDCLARKVLPYEESLYFLAALIQQGWKASVPFWPTEENMQAYLHQTHAQPEAAGQLHHALSSFMRMPAVSTMAIDPSAFKPQDVAWLRESMRSVFEEIRSSISCDICRTYAHKQMTALGVLLSSLLLENSQHEQAKMTPFQLQSVLLLTRFINEAFEELTSPSFAALTLPADLDVRGTYIEDHAGPLMLGMQREMRKAWDAQQHRAGSLWGRLRGNSSNSSSNAASLTSSPRGAFVPMLAMLLMMVISAF